MRKILTNIEQIKDWYPKYTEQTQRKWMRQQKKAIKMHKRTEQKLHSNRKANNYVNKLETCH